MPESLLARPRTFGVEADLLSDCELFLRRRCDNIAADVRGIIWGGGIELGFPCSNDVCNGSSEWCCMTGSCTGCPPEAIVVSFI